MENKKNSDCDIELLVKNFKLKYGNGDFAVKYMNDSVYNKFISKDDLLEGKFESDILNYSDVCSQNENRSHFKRFQDLKYQKFVKKSGLVTKIIMDNKKYYLCDIIKKKDFNQYNRKLARDFNLNGIKFFEPQLLCNDYLEVWGEQSEIIKNKKLKSFIVVKNNFKIIRVIFALILLVIIIMYLYSLKFEPKTFFLKFYFENF